MIVQYEVLAGKRQSHTLNLGDPDMTCRIGADVAEYVYNEHDVAGRDGRYYRVVAVCSPTTGHMLSVWHWQIGVVTGRVGKRSVTAERRRTDKRCCVGGTHHQAEYSVTDDVSFRGWYCERHARVEYSELGWM